VTVAREWIELEGERVSYITSHGDGMAVLFCHGNSTSAESFRRILEGPIGARYRAVALDFPGHGDSARDPRAYSIPGLVHTVTSFVAAKEWTRFALVGHSLGGHVLIEALDALRGASGAMLISAPPLRVSELAEVYRPDPTEGLLFAGALTAAQVARFAGALSSPQMSRRAMLEDAIARADPAFRTSLGASVAAGQLADEKEIAARTTLPIALVHGAEDPFIHAAYYRSVELGAPWRAGVFPIAGAGHSPHLDDRGPFADLLASFLRDCDVDAAA
jgi:pimeloyl-ACP methyl ester carboxylesterase